MIPHSRPTSLEDSVDAVAAVLRSGQHAGGAVRRTFEAELAAYCQQPHAIAVQSGSAALHLALLTLGVPRGAPVLTPSYACAALLNAIDAVGGVPLLADIDRECLSITSATAEAACAREGIEPEGVAAAIIPHMLGLPAPIDQWELPIPIVEDAAMALGVEVNGSPVGEYGEIAVVSFYATKMMSTGQGGAVVMTGDGFAEDARDRIQYDGRDEWRPSWNYPLPDLACAIGRPQLAALPGWIDTRRTIAGRYQEIAEQIGVARPPAPTGACHYRFLIELDDEEDRYRAAEQLAEAGIDAKPPVFRPLHRYLDRDDADFPVTTEIWQRGLSLPLYPSLSDEEIATVERGLAALGERVR